MFNRKTTFALLAIALVLVFSFGVLAEEKRMGTWVDEVVIVEEPNITTAISRLQAGDLDIYASAESQAVSFATIQEDPNLDYYTTFGSYSELTFNPVPVFNDGRLNPFGIRKVREAMNKLIDRDYIAQELYGGLALPKTIMLNNAYVDYSRVVETARFLEFKYAYDFEEAKTIIASELMDAGAKLVDGIWHWDGEPIEILILARAEDERKLVGDYVGEQLSKVGFVVTVDYRTSAEASPIWMSGDPANGQWHIYTGGWVAGEVYRDQGHIFEQMFSRRGMASPLWLAMDPIPELDDLCTILYNKKFTTMEERNQLFSRALELSLEDSPRIYTVDQISYIARRAEISVASDLAQGIGSTPLWPSTLRRGDEIGGRVTMATPQVLVEPWNPIAGSNWAVDQLAIRATFDRGFISNPYTGSRMPHRVERMEVTVQEGLPVAKSPDSDWVTLEFAEEIVVPGDAWLYWDPDLGRYITVAEKYPEGLTAPRKTVVYYREDLYDAVTWHDGSNWHILDFLLASVLGWDRGYEGSAIYDESAAINLAIDQENARGFRILSIDPFVYEAYALSWYIDAELNTADPFGILYDYGTAPWHTLALGVLAEINGDLAFSSNKAEELGIEQLGYNTGPSIPVLAKWLDYAIENNYLPWADFLGQFITEEEIAERYANLKAWYEEKEHFWLGTGPMYLERAYPVERMVHLKRYENYSEPADKWAIFDEPRIAEVDVTGGNRVRAGSEIRFEVEVTFKGEPYPLELIQEVKYIVLDATGSVAYSGYAEGIADGLFEIVLTAEDTAQLPIGSNTLETIVLPTPVAAASFGSHTFVTLP